MTRIFSTAADRNFGRIYETEVRPVSGGSSRGGCMKAVYLGLGALYGDDFTFRGSFHKAFFRRARKIEKARNLPEGRKNTIDRVFRDLERQGILFEEQTFKPLKASFRLRGGQSVPSLEGALLRQVANLPDGAHFFGVAVSGAIHSIILRITKDAQGCRVFWMDQFSNGFDNARPRAFANPPDVTGRLDEKVRGFGTNKTSVWMFNPDGAATVGIEIDSDGDGLPDVVLPAVVAA